MSKPKTTRFTIDLAADITDAVTRAAVVGNMPAEEFISDCVGQHCETALRHRVLIQRQNDVDEALLELARRRLTPVRRPERAAGKQLPLSPGGRRVTATLHALGCGPAAGTYYADDPNREARPKSRDNYYTRDGGGTWWTTGNSIVRHGAPVDKETFRNLCGGFDPRTGKALVRGVNRRALVPPLGINQIRYLRADRRRDPTLKHIQWLK